MDYNDNPESAKESWQEPRSANGCGQRTSSGLVVGFYVRHGLGFLRSFVKLCGQSSVQSSTRVSRQSSSGLASRSSASPLSTSPPWKCAQSVATGMWTDERIGAI